MVDCQPDKVVEVMVVAVAGPAIPINAKESIARLQRECMLLWVPIFERKKCAARSATVCSEIAYAFDSKRNG
jgi:hypothetical protein